MPFRGTPVRHRFDDALSRVDPGQFEHLVAAYYRSQGYDAVVTGSGHGKRRFKFDGGVDIELRRGGELTLVQCKRENAYQVPHNVVNQLYGVMHVRGAQHGIVVTTGEYTATARRHAAAHGMQLIDGGEIRHMLGHIVQPSPPPAQARVSVPASVTPRDVLTPPPSSLPAASDLSWMAARPRPPRRAPFPLRKLWLAIVLLAIGSVTWTYYQARALEQSHSVQAPPTPTIKPVHITTPPRRLTASVLHSKSRPAPAAVADPVIYRGGDMTDAQYQDWLRHRKASNGTTVVTDDTIVYRAGGMTQAEFDAWQRRRLRGNDASAPPNTAAELKAWQTKNAESMRILEQTTPSVQTY